MKKELTFEGVKNKIITTSRMVEVHQPTTQKQIKSVSNLNQIMISLLCRMGHFIKADDKVYYVFCSYGSHSETYYDMLTQHIINMYEDIRDYKREGISSKGYVVSNVSQISKFIDKVKPEAKTKTEKKGFFAWLKSLFY